MLEISTILKHYKREDIQREMVLHAKDREFSIMYGEKGFGKRPDVLVYPKDILELAKQGASSFHVSEELWKNPLQLMPMLKRSEIDNLRKGWDLVLDIDCPVFEYSKIAADLIVKALRHHSISAISAKFSGNKGFHIGVPFEAFPKNIMKTEAIDIKGDFPEGPRRIALYLKEMVKDLLAKKILELEKNNFENIKLKTGKSYEELVKIEKNKYGDIVKRLDAESILALDTILISSRHLYRMPYSLHEKSGLVSVPIDPDNILKFKKEDASPEALKTSKFRFLDRENVKPNQAKELFDKSLFSEMIKQKAIDIKKEENHYDDEIKSAIPEALFPPCIQNILKGLEDGRKRSLFILANFLTSVGWNYEQIENLLDVWNKKNKEPLRDVLIKGQLRYHKQQKKNILPPNCANSMYYKDLQICKPDGICSKIKNPVNYSKRKVFLMRRSGKGKKKVEI